MATMTEILEQATSEQNDKSAANMNDYARNVMASSEMSVAIDYWSDVTGELTKLEANPAYGSMTAEQKQAEYDKLQMAMNTKYPADKMQTVMQSEGVSSFMYEFGGLISLFDTNDRAKFYNDLKAARDSASDTAAFNSKWTEFENNYEATRDKYGEAFKNLDTKSSEVLAHKLEITPPAEFDFMSHSANMKLDYMDSMTAEEQAKYDEAFAKGTAQVADKNLLDISNVSGNQNGQGKESSLKDAFANSGRTTDANATKGQKHKLFNSKIVTWFFNLVMPNSMKAVNQRANNADDNSRYNKMTATGDQIALTILDLKDSAAGSPLHEESLEKLGKIYLQTVQTETDAMVSDLSSFDKKFAFLRKNKRTEEDIRKSVESRRSLSHDELEALGQKMIEEKYDEITKHISDMVMTADEYKDAVRSGTDIAAALDKNLFAKSINDYGDVAHFYGASFDSKFRKSNTVTDDKGNVQHVTDKAAFVKDKLDEIDITKLDATTRAEFGVVNTMSYSGSMTAEKRAELDDKANKIKERLSELDLPAEFTNTPDAGKTL